jgi:hypothetical protein
MHQASFRTLLLRPLDAPLRKAQVGAHFVVYFGPRSRGNVPSRRLIGDDTECRI